MFVMRSNSAGRFMLTTMAIVAELEAGLISAQRDGLQEQGGREEEARTPAHERAPLVRASGVSRHRARRW